MQNEKLLKDMINEATLISLDVFDTLLYRKTNSPEVIFDIIGRKYNIHNFKKVRMNAQDEASIRVFEKYKYPHANMDEIYEVLAEKKEYNIDWEEIKRFEIQLEKDSLVANKEMLSIFKYIKSIGKRVVATTDMYLMADTIKDFLEQNGYEGFDHIYCSADEHKAKFNKELFEHVSKCESVPFDKILHVGDKQRDDGEFPESFGIKSFIYKKEIDLEKLSKSTSSEVDNGLYKILYDSNKSFMYNLGVEVGGPLYIGLYLWMEKIVERTNKKVFFLSRDGYNLYHLFKNRGYTNVEYLYMSRRSLLLAGITEFKEKELEILPPFTRGQTIGEILEYLQIPLDKVSLEGSCFDSIDDVIDTDEDIINFKDLYIINKDIILQRCEYERKNAKEYLEKIGFFEDDSIIFDCGWNGSSQEILERFKKSINCKCKNDFYYFGIINTVKSRKQMHKKFYDTYLCNFYTNYSLQNLVKEAVAIFELFFSAPHNSVYYYSPEGVVFEDSSENNEKEDILKGIEDYLELGIDFIKKYDVEYTPEISVGHLERLVKNPTIDEAVEIGNINNVDGFAKQAGVEKYIAYITEEQFEINPNTEIYWITGFLKRNDISEDLKERVAKAHNVIYPYEKMGEYHLEDEQSIKNFNRWISVQCDEKPLELKYNPMFSVVIPVYNTIQSQLSMAIDSVLAQTYKNFELILVDDASTWPEVRETLKKYEECNNVKVKYREKNGNISNTTNDGINIASGEYIVFMDCDDTIEKVALYEFAKKINENPNYEFIYSDEDKITEDSKIRHLPFFKPDWSPDLFMSMMYTNHLAVYKLDRVKEVGMLRPEYDGVQDYDLTLRITEKIDYKNIGHISKILYHWRERKESVAYAMSSKNYVTDLTKYAKEEALKRRNISGHMEYIVGLNQYRVVYDPENNPKVSIIIPTKDHPDILMQCINSIERFTDYKNYEIVVVDNGSNAENKEIISNYLNSKGHKYIYDRYEFNFSKMCNIGARNSSGDYLLFLNDDTEMFQRNWLYRLVGHAQQKHVGIVGGKLLFPETTIIQHDGVSNIKEGPSHNYLYLDDSNTYGFGFNRIDLNTIAITGAFLMIGKAIFNEVGGFDESFPIAYNDIDLCFKVYEAGYYNVIRNDVFGYHYESLSRGNDSINRKKQLRLSAESQRLYDKHPSLKGRDPFLNKNIHNYSVILDLIDNYNKISRVDVSDAICDCVGNIDYINITNQVSVAGWSYIESREKNSELERYLVLQDIYDNTYKVDTNAYKRDDVAKNFNEENDTIYYGFECVIDRNVLSLEDIRYKIGILTIDKENVKHIVWLLSTSMMALERKIPSFANKEKLYITDKIENTSKRVIWNFDEIVDSSEDIYLRGWGICDEKYSYKYKAEIILRGEEEAYIYEADKKSRFDVAISMPNLHFIYNTGFVCRILKKSLKKGDYDIILKYTNKLDKDDINYVITDKKISVE